ncbi:MAG: STAS domain-containing protein [Candidatus Muiribacteriota bacterium]
MKYAIRYFNDICIIDLSGKVDFLASQFLDKILENRISKGNYKLLIDMEYVDYIGSNGFSVLINNLIKCREKDGDVKLTNLNHDISSLIKKIRLDEVFELFNNEDDAINNFYSGGEND